MPWRNTKDPYLIWLSEVILQQTRIDQGLSYYHRFAEKYPDVKSLAKAKEDDVLKLWQGLGYYSRARNLHAAAKQIVNEYDGKFPPAYEDILKLKGVGNYTASAIASFAFKKKHAVVDGNVYRLLSRYSGIATPIDTTAGQKQFALLAEELIDAHDPSVYNQAIMEFGSQQCRPTNPDCASCPLSNSCYAFSKNEVRNLPVKSKTAKIRKRYFHYFIFRNGKKIILRKRNENDIWKGLHDFPLIETENKTESGEILKRNISGHKLNKFSLKKISKEYKHILSHQHIHATFYELKFDEKLATPDEWMMVNESSLEKYAVPRLVEIYLSDKNKTYSGK